MSILHLLHSREVNHGRDRTQLRNLVEDSFVKMHDIKCISSDSCIISVALSPDGQTFASTHGDHTVKVFMFNSDKPKRVLRGHPRTPWSLKFHPTNSNFIASGCLGGEARVWDIDKNACMARVRHEDPIVCLNFDPIGECIAVVSGARLNLWDWRDSTAYNYSPLFKNYHTVCHTRNIRAVVFHPDGKYIFVAAPGRPREADRDGPHSLYYLELSQLRLSAQDNPETFWLVNNFRVYIPQIHLYSDGGLDISKDGQHLLTCGVLYNSSSSSSSADKHNQMMKDVDGDGEISSTALETSLETARMRDNDTHDPILTSITHTRSSASLYGITNMCGATNNGETSLHKLVNEDIDSASRRIRHYGTTPIGDQDHEENHICLFRLKFDEDTRTLLPPILYYAMQFPARLMTAVVSVKLSPTTRYALVAYGQRSNGMMDAHFDRNAVCDFIRLRSDGYDAHWSTVSTESDTVDEINNAQFHPDPGGGCVYGTKRGRIRRLLKSR